MLDPRLRLGRGVHAPLPQGVTIRQATLDDCGDLAPRLREEDKAEALAASGIPAEYALRLSIGRHGGHVACVDGRPEMIFGCPEAAPGEGAPWMFCSPVAVSPRWRKTFVRHSAPWIDAWQRRFPLLHNFTDARNSAHHAWLRRVGFVFIARVPYGPQGLPFLEFVRTSHV